MLLIRKKRGLGAGKMNAPGGKLEPGETWEAGAVRETQEEVGVTPLHMEHRGLLRFQFTDGYGLICAVFVARDLIGEPVETDEADPLWVPVDAVPYHEMWADDALWLPTVLGGGTFTGSFVFDGEKMLEQDVRLHGPYVPNRKPTAIVAGCGFTGLATARLLAANGYGVIGVTHSSESAEKLRAESFPVLRCDISDAHSVNEVLGDQHGADVVIHCASSKRGGSVGDYREVYLRGAQVLSGMLAPRHLIFTSSTSVYSQVTGERVSEESEAEPARETARILRETEEWVLAHGGTVARLSGIYGGCRSVLLRKYLAGEAVIEGDGSRWLNQIHRDDIAAALLQLVKARALGVFNVSDNCPIQQKELYVWLSAYFGEKLPPSGPVDMNRKRAWTHKQVSNAKMRALGWVPQYASFYDAVEKDPELVLLARQDCANLLSLG